MTVEILQGDCRTVLATLEACSVQCVVTSPPYWQLRDYKISPSVWGGSPNCTHVWGPGEVRHVVREETTAGKTRTTDRSYGEASRRFDGNHQKHTAGSYCEMCGAWLGALGLESTIQQYIVNMVEVFASVNRVLREDGVCWLNLGDSYAHDDKWGGATSGKHSQRLEARVPRKRVATGMKPKDLCMVPHRVAIALQDWGWWVRSDVVWSKPNAMPSSVRDRPATSHEYVFLLTKSARYFYDAESVKQPATGNAHRRGSGVNPKAANTPTGWDTTPGPHTRLDGHYPRSKQNPSFSAAVNEVVDSRNLRSVWEIPTQPYVSGHEEIDHFATFPEALVEPCILAGTSAHGACAACGAPWARVLERQRMLDGQPAELGSFRTQSIAEPSGAQGVGHWRIHTETQEKGWRKTCRCHTDEIRPCVVLDPFAGSGTVLRVATRLGRDSIGVDINPAYLILQERRTTGVQLPLTAP